MGINRILINNKVVKRITLGGHLYWEKAEEVLEDFWRFSNVRLLSNTSSSATIAVHFETNDAAALSDGVKAAYKTSGIPNDNSDKTTMTNIGNGDYSFTTNFGSGGIKYIKFCVQKGGLSGASNREWSDCYVLLTDRGDGMPSIMTLQEYESGSTEEPEETYYRFTNIVATCDAQYINYTTTLETNDSGARNASSIRVFYGINNNEVTSSSNYINANNTGNGVFTFKITKSATKVHKIKFSVQVDGKTGASNRLLLDECYVSENNDVFAIVCPEANYNYDTGNPALIEPYYNFSYPEIVSYSEDNGTITCIIRSSLDTNDSLALAGGYICSVKWPNNASSLSNVNGVNTHSITATDTIVFRFMIYRTGNYNYGNRVERTVYYTITMNDNIPTISIYNE